MADRCDERGMKHIVLCCYRLRLELGCMTAPSHITPHPVCFIRCIMNVIWVSLGTNGLQYHSNLDLH